MKKATIYDLHRICRQLNEFCSNCPLGGKDCSLGPDCTVEDVDEINEIILKWCKEHPINTRQDEFLKMFPNAATNGNGRPSICPKNLDRNYGCELKPNACGECMDNYWLAEVDE